MGETGKTSQTNETGHPSEHKRRCSSEPDDTVVWGLVIWWHFFWQIKFMLLRFSHTKSNRGQFTPQYFKIYSIEILHAFVCNFLKVRDDCNHQA